MMFRLPEPLASSLVSISDLEAFVKRRYGMIDTHATTGLWLALVRVDDEHVKTYDEHGTELRGAGATLETAERWRLTVSSVVACAQARMPYGRGMALREKLSSLTVTQEEFLWLGRPSLPLTKKGATVSEFLPALGPIT